MRDLSERFIILEESKGDRVRAYDKLLMRFISLRQVKSGLSLGKVLAILDKLMNLDKEFLKVIGYQTLDNGTVYVLEDLPPQENVDLKNNTKELLQVTRYIGRMFEYLNSLGLRVRLPDEDKIYKDDSGKYFMSPIDLIDMNNPDRVQSKEELLDMLTTFFISFAPKSLKDILASLVERNIIHKIDNADALVNMLNTFILQEEKMKSKTEVRKQEIEVRKERRRISPWIIVIPILVVLAGVSVWMLYSIGERLLLGDGSVPDVIVPDIVNRSLTEAYGLLKTSGLNIEISGLEYSSAIPAGNIISQEPASGSKVKQGRSVKVTVSKGIELINVPNIVGQDLNNARKTLESVGLKIGDIRETPSRTSPDGIVISQNPKYGSITSKNSLVALEISRHLQSNMPRLVGKPFEDVEKILKPLGPYILIVKEQESDTPGVVISQSPSTNTILLQEIPRIEIVVGIPRKVIPKPVVPPSTSSDTDTPLPETVSPAPSNTEMPLPE